MAKGIKEHDFPLAPKEFLNAFSAAVDRAHSLVFQVSDADLIARQDILSHLTSKSLEIVVLTHKGIRQEEHLNKLAMVQAIFDERVEQILSAPPTELTSLMFSLYSLPHGKDYSEEYPFHSIREEYLRWRFGRFPKRIRVGGGQRRFDEICQKLNLEPHELAY